MPHRVIPSRIILIAIVSIFIGSSYCHANPKPWLDPPPANEAGGGPTAEDHCFVDFWSENVTVHIAEDAAVTANYTFHNPHPGQVNQTILLPFYSRPSNLTISIEGNQLSYVWTEYRMEDSSDDDYYFTYQSAKFILRFDAHEFITIDVNYSRAYRKDEHYEGDHYNSFIYLTRTGASWNEPIRYANFQFYLHKDECTGCFDDGGLYSEFYNLSMGHYKNVYDLYAAAFLTHFLTDFDIVNDTYYHLSREFSDWVPEKDIGLTWIHYSPEADMSLSFDIRSTTVEMSVNAKKSYDRDGTIESFKWRFWEIDGWVIENTNISFSHTFSGRGQYGLSLEVEDDRGNKGMEKTYILINYTIDELELNITTLPGFENISWWRIWWCTPREVNFSTGIHDLLVTVPAGYYQYEYLINRYRIIIMDVDSDGDGVLDSLDRFPFDSTEWEDSDGDDIGNNRDRDDDNDLWNDTMELNCGTDPYDNTSFPTDLDNDWIPDAFDDDIDGDGVNDEADAFPEDATQWKDTDGDGHGDNLFGISPDRFPDDPAEWQDQDRDGVGDNSDDFVSDPAASVDSDGDGYPEEWNPHRNESHSVLGLHRDSFPDDPAASLDSDGDGYPNRWNEPCSKEDSTTRLVLDWFPDDPHEWADWDNDGVGDNSDAFPDDHAASADSDGDGHPDRWNPGKSGSHSPTGLSLDDYPYDSVRWSDDKQGNDYADVDGINPFWSGLVIIIGLLFVIGCVFSSVIHFRKLRNGRLDG